MSENVHLGARMKKELVISSKPENIHLVEQFIDEIRKDYDFKDDVYGNVMVAITEAVNNSIYHGNQSEETKRVFISCEQINPYRIMVGVRDEGTGFDYEALPDPTAPENLANIGGRGVFLMKHLSDEINFGDEGREVEMIFNI